MSTAVWSDPTMQAAAALIRRRTGLVFPEARRNDFEAAIRVGMARANHTDLDAYLLVLATSQDALADLIQDLVVGETYFFRDSAYVDLLRDQVIPSILERRKDGGDIRIWSAGCAAGEEAYTVAILVDEMGIGDRAQIVATDISVRATERARTALYSQWSLRGLSEAIVQRCFTNRDGQWELKERFRRNVRVHLHNLAADACPSISHGLYGLDLILCRNVLMYLGPDTIPDVAAHFHECLADGGWLVTSPTDPIIAAHAAFDVLTTPAGVVYRRPMPHRYIHVIEPAGATEPCTAAQSAPPPAEVDMPQRVMPPVPATIERTPLDLAREALASGAYVRAIELARTMPELASAWAVMSRATANMEGPAAALLIVQDGLAAHPLDIELRFLRALFLIDQGRDDSAIEALGRVVYLDPSLAIAQYAIGAQLRRAGDMAGALKAFSAAYAICEPLPHDALLPMSDGERAGDLRELAAAELSTLRAATGASVR